MRNSAIRTLALWAAASVAAGALPALAQTAAPATSTVAANEYRLGSGDVVRIPVFQNPDLTLETRITEAGIVSYPLLGNVRPGDQIEVAVMRLSDLRD